MPLGMYSLHLLDALQLNDQLVFYQYVHPIAAVETHAFVLHW